MRFVFVTDELPRPDLAGHLAMNHAIVVWLQGLGHHVTILLVGARLTWPLERYGVAPVAGPLVAAGRGVVLARSPSAQAKIAARGVLARLPAAFAERVRRRRRAPGLGATDAVLGAFVSAPQAAWCAAYLEKTRPDTVIIDTIFRAPVLQLAGRRHGRGVIVAHDVFHARHRALTLAGYRVQPAALPAVLEAELLNTADAVVAIQPEEAAAIREMCPARNVFTAPMPASPHPRPAGAVRLANRLVFVGSASLPNLDGLRWFLANVWPHLRRWGGGVTLDIVGDCGAGLSRVPEGVNRLGRIDRLGGVLHRASLAIAPLRVGSGLKIKLLDYARHGLMTVATPASLRGFATDPAAPFIAAEHELDFATAIVRQLGAGSEDARALAYVERYYGTSVSFAGLAAALGLPPLVLCRGSSQVF